MANDEIVKPREIVKADNELFRAKYGMKNTLASRIFMAFASLVDENDVATEGAETSFAIVSLHLRSSEI